MKSASLYLLLASAASTSVAFVLPEEPVAVRGAEDQQAPFDGGVEIDTHLESDESPVHGLWDAWLDRLSPVKDSVEGFIDAAATHLADGFESAADALQDLEDNIQSELRDAADATGREFPDLTIYQLIQKSEHATRVAKVIDEHPDVVKLLNSTDGGNHTFFVPIDSAFEHIPEHGDPPSKEFVDAVLRYHIGVGEYPLGKLLYTNTLPTEHDEKRLGGPQRLRTRISLTGLRVNFFSKVVAADFKAKNGILHAVDHILVPPPVVGLILTWDPSHFSTLLLAYEKTEFVKFVHGLTLVGSTAFAPDNDAFAALGPRANAFLFNTEKGNKCLKALLKYHIAPNATLYTDAFYDETGSSAIGSDDDDVDAETAEHFSLDTLLDGASVGVDIDRILGFKVYVINAFTKAKVDDVVSKNGVIQVVNKVLIPPRKRKGEEDTGAVEYMGGEIEPEDLMERLADYMEEEEVEEEQEL